MSLYSYKNETNSSVSIGGITFDPQETKNFADRQPVLDVHVNLTVLSRYIDQVFDETVPLSELEKHNEDHKHMSGIIYGSPTFSVQATFGSQSRYQELTDSWGFGTITPTHQMHVVVRNGDNILIDGRTNPRQYTFGVMRFEHTSAITGTRPITLDIDCNGFHTKGIVIDYKATGIGAGTSHVYEVNIDTANSTSGVIQVVSVSKSGTGLAEILMLEAYAGVDVLLQKTGSPIYLTQAWKTTSGVFSDTTAAFSSGANVQLFANDNDYIYCGSDSVFNQMEIYLDIKASNTILAVFEYSTGAGTWTTFSPSDGTNGFTTNGNIMWTQALAGWVAATINGVSKYYLRIQRTRNSLATPPTEVTIQVVATTNFFWDKNGDISIRKGRSSGLPVYADRTAALAGGLLTGDWYQQSDGTLMAT